MWVNNDWDATSDQKTLDGVTVSKLLPQTTGFPAWSRGKAERGAAEWVYPSDYKAPSDGTGASRMLLLHGGAYAWYSPRDYRPMSSRLAKSLGMPVLVIDYRLAPEHRYPAAVDDAVAACRWLRRNGPCGASDAGKIYLFGDSSGGGLVFATLQALKQRGDTCAETMASLAGAVSVSPWVDLTCSGITYKTRGWNPETLRGDVQFSSGDEKKDRESSRSMSVRYVGKDATEKDLKQPLVSPLFAKDWTEICPTLILVGDEECSLDEAVQMHKVLQLAGNECTLRVFDRMWHVWINHSEGCGSGRTLAEAIGGYMCIAAFCGISDAGREAPFIKESLEKVRNERGAKPEPPTDNAETKAGTEAGQADVVESKDEPIAESETKSASQ